MTSINDTVAEINSIQAENQIRPFINYQAVKFVFCLPMVDRIKSISKLLENRHFKIAEIYTSLPSRWVNKVLVKRCFMILFECNAERNELVLGHAFHQRKHVFFRTTSDKKISIYNNDFQFVMSSFRVLKLDILYKITTNAGVRT